VTLSSAAEIYVAKVRVSLFLVTHYALKTYGEVEV
jgi:hypothetical protein